jgi:hypothetical protein
VQVSESQFFFKIRSERHSQAGILKFALIATTQNLEPRFSRFSGFSHATDVFTWNRGSRFSHTIEVFAWTLGFRGFRGFRMEMVFHMESRFLGFRIESTDPLNKVLQDATAMVSGARFAGVRFRMEMRFLHAIEDRGFRIELPNHLIKVL